MGGHFPVWEPWQVPEQAQEPQASPQLQEPLPRFLSLTILNSTAATMHSTASPTMTLPMFAASQSNIYLHVLFAAFTLSSPPYSE